MSSSFLRPSNDFPDGNSRNASHTVLGRIRGAVRRRLDRRLVRRSGLFDTDWYLASYPGIRASGGDPLTEFLDQGWLNGRNPNPYFDVEWYRETYLRPDHEGMNPLVHYLRRGAKAGARPSLRFDSTWYASRYTDIARAKLEPLGHFLRHGLKEGRRALPPSTVTKPVEAAELRVVKAASISGGELAIFVTHAPNGMLKPHVRMHAQALRMRGFIVVVVAAVEVLASQQLESLSSEIDGLYLRANEGYDFAAWAHVAGIVGGIETSDAILLVNDSVVGPINESDFDRVIERMRNSRAELVGLTDNYEHVHHLQSYFLYAKERGVAALLHFMSTVVSHAEKEQVIDTYEITLLEQFEAQGLSGEALFPAQTDRNESIWRWQELIESGMPFVKVQALRGYPGVDSSRWQEILASRGYDPATAQATLDITARVVGSQQRGP